MSVGCVISAAETFQVGTVRFTDSFADRLTDGLADTLTDRLADRLTDRLMYSFLTKRTIRVDKNMESEINR